MELQERHGPGVAGDDPRLALVYQEAVRGIQHQERVVESLNARAGNLVFAAAFATSVLGARALSDGPGPWDWTAVALLFGIGALVAFMLWPYHAYTFRFDPEELLRRYVDGREGVTLPALHRELALRIQADLVANWRLIQRIRVALQVALLLLPLQILAWLFSIGSG